MSREFLKGIQIKIYVCSSLNHTSAPICVRDFERPKKAVQQKHQNHIFLTLRNSTYLYRSKNKKERGGGGGGSLFVFSLLTKNLQRNKCSRFGCSVCSTGPKCDLKLSSTSWASRAVEYSVTCVLPLLVVSTSGNRREEE